eukprot:COSAG06_NODE_30839_length_531_cov_1.372685_1_plen_63_part_01
MRGWWCERRMGASGAFVPQRRAAGVLAPLAASQARTVQRAAQPAWLLPRRGSMQELEAFRRPA